MVSKRFEEARFVLVVVEALRLAKQRYSYRELSKATGVPAPHLSRYVTGRGLPSLEKARQILEGLWRLANPRKALAERLAETGGILDTSIVLTEPFYLLLAALYFMERIDAEKVTRILVPEASGIPFATTLSLALEKPFVVARRGPVLGDDVCSDTVPSFCIPRGSLSRADTVLLVDDIVETGRTLLAMKSLAEKTGARISSVVALVVVGEEWSLTSGLSDIEALVKLTKPGARRVPSL